MVIDNISIQMSYLKDVLNVVLDELKNIQRNLLVNNSPHEKKVMQVFKYKS